MLMRGLPFKVTVEEIQSFFREYADLMKTDIVIEEIAAGKRSGKALVFFDHEETMKKAKIGLDKSNLGSRYVELFDHRDQAMVGLIETTRKQDES